MKKYLLLFLLFPVVSFAGGIIQVDHTVQNVDRRGTLTPSDMASVIEYKSGTLTQSGSGSSQMYDLSNSNTSPTDFKVRAPFISNYEYTTAGSCEGSIADNQVKICVLQWTDTGRAEAPVVRQEPVAQSVPVTLSPAEDPEKVRALQLQVIELLTQLIQLLTLQLNGLKIS